MLNLSLIPEVEKKIKKELRHYTTFLLIAGNREHERNAWNLLLEVTNNLNQNNAPTSASTPDDESISWIEKQHHMSLIAWKNFPGDILITLLALAGDDTKMWQEQKQQQKDVKEDGNLVVTTVLTEPEARMHRYLLPHEKRRCRDLFFQIIFYKPNSNNWLSTAQKFDVLLPLLLSFSSSSTKNQLTKTEKQEEVQLPLASSGTLRSIVSASITGLLMMKTWKNDTANQLSSPLYSLLYSTVCEKAEIPPSEMMESGFRIAEAVAAPPVSHGWIVVVDNNDSSSSSSATFHWQPNLSSDDIVLYFTSLLQQIGNDVLLRLAPSRQTSEEDHDQNQSNSRNLQQQQQGIKSTNIRMLCACLFLIGRLLVVNNNHNNNNNQTQAESSSDFSSLRKVLSLFSLPRLFLVDRELLAPAFGSLRKSSALHRKIEQEGEDEQNSRLLFEQEKSLLRLECLLTALQATPTMVLSDQVEKSVNGIVILIWEKVGDGVVRLALNENTRISQEQQPQPQRVARSCLRLVFSSIAERILRKDTNKFRSRNLQHGNNEQEMPVLHSILLQPIVDTVAECFNNNENDSSSRASDDDDQEDPLSMANRYLDEVISLVYETTRSIVAIPTLSSNQGATSHLSNITTTTGNNINSTTSSNLQTSSSTPVQIVSTLILSELFKVAVSSQENRGRDSLSDQAHTFFLSLFLSKVTPKQMLAATAGLSSSSSSSSSLAIFDQLLRFCRWTLRFSTTSSSSTKEVSGLALITLDMLSNLDESSISISTPAFSSSSLKSSNNNHAGSDQATVLETMNEQFESTKLAVERISKAITDIEVDVANLDFTNNTTSTIQIRQKQENCLRNLEVFKRGLSEMISAFESEVDRRRKEYQSNDEESNGKQQKEEKDEFNELISSLNKLFQEATRLHERKMSSILTVTLMELCDKVKEIPFIFKKIVTKTNITNCSESDEQNKQSTSSMNNLWKKLHATEIFKKQTEFLVKNILLKSAQLAEMSSSSSTNSNNNSQTKTSSSSSTTRTSLGRFRSSARNGTSQTSGTGYRFGQSSSSKSAADTTGTALSPNSSLFGNHQEKSDLSNTTRKDDQVISATCSLLSLIVLLRLDASDDKDQNKNNGMFQTMMRQALSELLAMVATLEQLTKEGNSTSSSINNNNSQTTKLVKNISIMSSFCATLLDVVIRVSDEDREGLTVKNLMFDVGNESTTSSGLSAETLCLEVIREQSSSSHHHQSSLLINYQALRLCCLNVLGKCYQLVPVKCNFDVVEALIVGVFRTTPYKNASSKSSSSGASDQDSLSRIETQQILRLAASALLSSVMHSVVVSIFSVPEAKDVEEKRKMKNTQVETLKRVRGFCLNVSHYRNHETRLFEDEIREHGRVAERHLRASCPEDILGLILAMEEMENDD